jgi:hypothetical protein
MWLDDAPTFLMLLDTSYLSEYGILRTNKRVWLPPHKIFSVLRTCGFLDKDWNGPVGGWMDGWDWLVVCWGMMWTLDSYGVGCIHV